MALTFLPSLGPSLRPLDLEFMKHLSKVVNIIPVIAKADTMTLEEKSEFKQRVSWDLSVLFLPLVLPSSPLGPNHLLSAMSSSTSPVLHPNSLPFPHPRQGLDVPGTNGKAISPRLPFPPSPHLIGKGSQIHSSLRTHPTLGY